MDKSSVTFSESPRIVQLIPGLAFQRGDHRILLPGVAVDSESATLVWLGTSLMAPPLGSFDHCQDTWLDGPGGSGRDPPTPDPSSGYSLAGLTSEALTISAMAHRTCFGRRGQRSVR